MKDQTITSKDEAKRELERLNKECFFLTPKVHQALDIVIECIQQEKDFYNLLQDRIDYYDDLITKTENLDVRATYCGTYDELIYILNLIKKVEPYKRKEQV